MRELYISVDIETDGPIPGDNPMLSLGAAAFLPDSDVPIDAFKVNLRPRGGATADPNTAQFWARNPEAYKAATVNPKHPQDAMADFVDWCNGLKDQYRLVFVAYPASFDWMFVYWYLVHYKFKSPFGFSACLDMKSYAAAVLGLDLRKSVKSNWPDAWFGEVRHSHNAVEDAVEQGVTFVRMYQAAHAR